MRLAALLVAAALLVSTGCAPRHATRTTLITTGTVVAAIGVGMLVAMRNDDDEVRSPFDLEDDNDGPTEGELQCFFGGCLLSAVVIAGGAGMIVGGIASGPDDEPIAPPRLAPAVVDAGPAAPVAAAPGQPVAAPGAADADPLPALATDAKTRSYARAVHLAIGQQRCPLAQVLLRDIARRDPPYHAALVANPTVAACHAAARP